LWHALLQDNNSIGSTFNTNILLPAFYALERSKDESVDSYWNRFQTQVRRILRDPSIKLEKSHIRRQFLLSLGTDFEFLGADIENESLNAKWLCYSDEELKSELRKIQQNKKINPCSPATTAAFGYAHAMKTEGLKPAQMDSNFSNQEVKIDALCTLVADQAKAMTAQTEALNKCVLGLNSKSQSRLKYCWTHGENFTHNSSECKKQTTGHHLDATWKNRMGGSNRTVKRE